MYTSVVSTFRRSWILLLSTLGHKSVGGPAFDVWGVYLEVDLQVIQNIESSMLNFSRNHRTLYSGCDILLFLSYVWVCFSCISYKWYVAAFYFLTPNFL